MADVFRIQLALVDGPNPELELPEKDVEKGVGSPWLEEDVAGEDCSKVEFISSFVSNVMSIGALLSVGVGLSGATGLVNS